LRQIDDHAVRIGQREGMNLDLLVEIDHHSGLRLVAAQPHLARHRETIEGISGHAGRPGPPRDAEQDRSHQDDQACCADRHRIASPPGTSLTH